MRVLNTTNKRWTALTASLLAGTGLTWAERVHELAPVEVIGQAESLFAMPGSGYRVDGQVLDAFDLTDVNRLLTRVPGVYFREEDGFGLISNISLRGVDTSRSAKLTLMEDGIPTAPAPYSAPSAYYTPMLGRMSSVEILKGTSQVRFGPHTTGGVINYLSTPVAGKRAGMVKLGAGTDGDFSLHGWLSDRWVLGDGKLDVLIEGNYHENDGFQTINQAGTYGGSDDTGFEREEAMVKLAWGSKDGRHRLEFKLGASHLQADLSYLGLNEADFRDDPFQRYAASRLDVFDGNHSRTYLRYGLRMNDSWTLNLTGYYNTFHRNWYKLNDIRDLDLDGDGEVEGVSGDPVRLGLSQAVAGAENGAGLEALKGERAAVFRVRANNRDYYLAGVEGVLQGNRIRGEWEHSPLFGVRYHTDRIRRFQWHDQFTQTPDGSWSDPVTSAPGSDGNRRQQTDATALFFEDEWTNGKWVIRPGARIEFLELKYEDFTTDGSNERITEATMSMDVWSAGLAGTYLIDEKRAAFVNLYRGFSVPNPRSAIRGGITEETSNSFEVGFRYRDTDGSLALEVVGFYTHFDDLIVIDNIGSGSSGDPDTQPVTENVGAVDSYGLEFLARGDLHRSDDGSWSLPASMALTWTVAELDGPSNSTDPESIFAGGMDGNRLPYIPEISLNITVGFEAESWSTGLSLSWRDSTYSTATETGGEINPETGEPDARFGKIDSVLLLDWNIQYRITDTVRVFANVNNILDREHLVSRHPHGARAGAPRQAGLGVAVTF